MILQLKINLTVVNLSGALVLHVLCKGKMWLLKLPRVKVFVSSTRNHAITG